MLCNFIPRPKGRGNALKHRTSSKARGNALKNGAIPKGLGNSPKAGVSKGGQFS